jgi:hypothetical protein
VATEAKTDQEAVAELKGTGARFVVPARQHDPEHRLNDTIGAVVHGEPRSVIREPVEMVTATDRSGKAEGDAAAHTRGVRVVGIATTPDEPGHEAGTNRSIT